MNVTINSLLTNLQDYRYLTDRIELYQTAFGASNSDTLRLSLKVLKILMPRKVGFLWHESGEIAIQFHDNQDRLNTIEFDHKRFSLANRDEEIQFEQLKDFENYISLM